MRWLREFFRVISLEIESSLHRPRHLVMVAAGLLIASSTLLVVLTIPAGLSRIAAHTGRDDVAVVLASSRRDESDGSIDPELVQRIGTLPGVTRDASDAPLIAPQFVAHAKLPRRDGMPSTILIRGATPAIWRVVGDSVRVAQGQQFATGLDELVSGSIASRKYVYAQTGSNITLARSIWHVSGEFDAGGSLWDSEFWADLDALQAAFNTQGQITTIWVRLTTPAAFTAFEGAMQSDPRLHGFTVMKQHDFYAGRVALLMLFVEMVAWVIAIVLGLQTILASYNSIGLSLRARRGDLAVLRALGFGPSVLFAALLIEILLIALVCAILIVGLGIVLLNGYGIDSSAPDASIHFTAAVTPHVALSILGYTVALGLASALAPASRSLRAPLIPALSGE